MRIFNIGIREVILLLVIMLILFGPRQMQENARNLAKGIRKFVRSDTWRTFLGLVDDVNSIKDQVIRESGIQEVQDSLRGVNRQLNSIDSELHSFTPQIIDTDTPLQGIDQPDSPDISVPHSPEEEEEEEEISNER